VAETAFDLKYDGPALESGRMPVRDLAPALLALGELFTEASAVVYPDRDPVALDIKATAEGSFIIDLILQAPGAWESVRDFFSSDDVTALVNLQNLVLGSGGLFALTVFLRGRVLGKNANAGVQPGHIHITLPNGSEIDVPAEVLELYDSIRIRRAAREVVAPLARKGVDRLVIRPENSPPVTIEAEDLDAFDPPSADAETPLLERETELVVSIASVAFIEGNKWRLSDGDRIFYATVEDEAFLARIERGVESFRKGDMLRCRVLITQTSSDLEGLKTDYRVLEVLEHIPRSPHPELWRDDEPTA
jgi:hypothetical protein